MLWNKKKTEDLQPIAASILAASIQTLSGAVERFALYYEKEKEAQKAAMTALESRIIKLEEWQSLSTYHQPQAQMKPHEPVQGPDDNLRDLMSRPDQHPL